MHDIDSPCQGRGEELVAYMYGEDDSGARAELELHLARCSRCRQAMSGLGAVRGVLREWTPPDPRDGALADRVTASPSPRTWRSLSDVPRWAQAVAAILVLGVAAGVANVEVRYGPDGLVVRTGWSAIADPATPPTDAAATAAAIVPVVMSDLEAAKPWQTNLTVLGDGLRQELAPKVRPAQPVDQAAILDRVRELVEQSEARQRRELALRLAEAVQEGQLQRRVNLQRIDRTLGAIESSSRLHQLRYNEAINSLNLAVRAGLTGRE